MLNWVIKKGQNARIWGCTKELLWDLEKSDALRRAKILALASAMRIYLLTEFDFEAFNQPNNYSREDLMRIYEPLEDLRNASNKELSQLKNNMSGMGMELPNFAKNHMIQNNRGLELWMVTIGTGVNAKCRESVCSCWKFLRDSYSFVPEAIEKIKSSEKQTMEITGSLEDGQFSEINIDSWLELANFTPKFLKNSA